MTENKGKRKEIQKETRKQKGITKKQPVFINAN